MPTALVTGAAKRLGRAMALYLAERGYDVAVHYAGSATEAEAVAEDVQSKGRKAITVQADLTIEADMQSLVPRATDALGAPLVPRRAKANARARRAQSTNSVAWDSVWGYGEPRLL